MRYRSVSLLLAGLILLASAAPANAPRQTAPGEALMPHPVAAGKVDRTGYIKGIYVSYSAMGDTGFMQRVQGLLEDTELNAVVFDFKGDHGLLSFPSQVKVAKGIGADQAPVIRDSKAFLSWFQQHNIYTIARIVTFKDDLLSEARPDWAVIDVTTGHVWHDQEGMGWVDPFRQSTWDYNAALALEAAQLGFDEVQFDYVRFPTDGNIGNTVFSLANNEENRTKAITGFLNLVRRAITPLGTKIGVDIFGYTAWVPDDLGIGQHIEALAPYVDVLAPMLYPSTFNAGLPGESDQYDNAVAYPYEIVHLSTQRTLTRARAVNPAIQVRPWLQDFQDYAFDGRVYTPSQIRLQMEGGRAAGGRGWMLWDPAVQYTREALVSAKASYIPNPSGKVLVLSYRDFASVDSADAVSPQTLRANLEKLLAMGFYPINLRDLTEGKLRNVPAGKRPVALTFDDATAEQFRLLAGGAIDPDCAVGVLLDMNTAHPADWPLHATFFVRPGDALVTTAPFGSADLASTKLQLLVTWGMEVAAQPLNGKTLNALSPEEVRKALEGAVVQIGTWLPGYRVATLALPDEFSPSAPAGSPSGIFKNRTYAFTGAVLPDGGLAPSPDALDFDPYRLPRVPAQELAQWLAQAERVDAHYVSGGE